MKTLTIDRQTQVISALVEGCSIRSTERMTGIHRDSIMRLAERVGKGCERLLDESIRGVRCERLELDEVWAFVGKKKANLTREDDVKRTGDFWTWVALDPDTKLVPAYTVGKRDLGTAREFAHELGRRVEGRLQVSSDKLAAYRTVMHHAWGNNVDYGRIVKRYASDVLDTGRYSPPHVVGADRYVVLGDPNPALISTSHVERCHGTMRGSVRRLTRLTSGFSKKLEGLKAAVALHFAHYNFVRLHGSITTTPALASGVADHRWSLPEFVEWTWLRGR